MTLEDIHIPESKPFVPADHPVRPPIIDDEGILRIDNSSLEHFTTCARSAQYYLLDRREVNTTRTPLIFGGFIHECMEQLYKVHNGYPQDMKGFVSWMQTRAETYFENIQIDADDFRTPQRAIDTMISYVALNEFEPFVVHKVCGVPQVELYFELPLGEIEYNAEFNGKMVKTLKVLWTGRIDVLIEMDGKLWVLDHKTTSILGDNFWADFINSSPAIGYTWAAQQILQRPVEGLFANALAIRKPSKAGVPFDNQRQRFPYDPERIEEWKYNTLTLISDFVSHMDRNFFPMETKWCVGKYGKCPYLDICSLPPAQRETMLQSNFYRNVTWTPKNR